jgi:hypothetical protein
MPAKTEKQRRFMGAELGRLREGKKTQTGMSESDLEDFAKKRKKKKKLPTHGSGELTPLGQRTLGGYQEKFGDEAGHSKFEAAVSSGMLERKRMFVGANTRDARGGFRSQNG